MYLKIRITTFNDKRVMYRITEYIMCRHYRKKEKVFGVERVNYSCPNHPPP